MLGRQRLTPIPGMFTKGYSTYPVLAVRIDKFDEECYLVADDNGVPIWLEQDEPLKPPLNKT